LSGDALAVPANAPTARLMAAHVNRNFFISYPPLNARRDWRAPNVHADDPARYRSHLAGRHSSSPKSSSRHLT
jgi:hypothetical protein